VASFIAKKLFYSLLVLFGIATIVFLLFSVLPGDPARMMLGQRADQESVEAISHELGLDQPLATQYFGFLNDVSPIGAIPNDKLETRSHLPLISLEGRMIALKFPYLRRSFQLDRNVTDVLLDAVPGTAILAVLAISLALFFGILFGIFGALNKGGWLDQSLMVLSIFGMSLPSFVAAILVVWVFAYLLGDWTGLPVTGSLFTIDEFEGPQLMLRNMILPVFTLGVRPLAILMQLTRNSMLDVLSHDYVRTATAKGLPQSTVIWKHTLKNALNPVITAASGWFASLLAGAVFVEIVFGWQGLGLVILNALNTYDIPVVMGAVMLVSGVFVIISLAVDLLYGIFDPRVRIQ
jgi:peptide/nickel transport system permease protein